MSGGVLWLCVLLAAGSSAVDGNGDDDTQEEQHLCEMMVKTYNTLVDMVPFILPITFPYNNDYFVGSAEVMFYPADDSSNSPKCSVFYDKDLTMLRIDVILRIAILNKGSRMDITDCRLEAHLRLQKDEEHLFLDPQLVDVQIPGSVYRDGVLLDKKQADEILRPTLIKGFTSLASKYLSYSGYRSSALYVDPGYAASLFKQLLMSYLSQIVR